MHKIISFIKSVPVTLLIFCIASFGLLIPTLGFYWDDWPMIWFSFSQGPLGFPAAFAGDRPFLSIVYVITTTFLKFNPISWQIFSLLTRWLLAWATFWTLNQIWHDSEDSQNSNIFKKVNFWIALLVAIYPGFKQQPISVVYSNGLVLLISYVLSFGFMARTIHHIGNKWVNISFGLFTYLFCTFSTEYYIGLDLIRPLLIYYLLLSSNLDFIGKIKKAFAYWSPYLVSLVIFLFWRVFIFQFPTYQPTLIEEVTTKPLSEFFKLAYTIVFDIINSGWVAWTEPFYLPEFHELTTSTNIAHLLLIIFSILFSWLFFRYVLYKNIEPFKSSKIFDRHANLLIFSGLISMFLAGWPFWITGLRIELSYPYDRFNLAFMFGSAMLIIGLLEKFIRSEHQKLLILSILIGMSVGSHFVNANSYRREWMTHNDFFWQLSWRAPDLKPGTSVLTKGLPFNYYSDNSLTAPLNIIYAPDNKTLELDYMFGFLEVRVGRSIPDYNENLDIVQNFRNAQFNSSTSSSLLLFYSPPGCLRIIDPVIDKNLPILPWPYEEAMQISHLDQIILSPEKNKTPQSQIFSIENTENWCYYFQKADLARQSQDWDTITTIGNEAFSKGYFSKEPSENVVFIEGFANSGNLDQAMKMTNELYQQAPQNHKYICDALNRISLTTNFSAEEEILFEETYDHINCD
ncbi:MAG: hypothetical protein JEZ03_08335 [Bacteroidales bacterium]|nr:hypothetical protein [Bacteroidales bacterium]